MENSVIEITQKGAVGIVSIANNDGLNILNRSALHALAKAMADLEAKDEINAIMIQGSNKAFSIGVDTDELANDANPDGVDDMWEDFEQISGAKKPTIAIVSGFAIGLGFEIAMACDIILSSDNAIFSIPDLSMGVIPGFGATQRLIAAVGKSKAMEMILSCRSMSAREAERVGLISRIIPLAYLKEEAFKVAEKIAEHPSLPVITAKELIKTAAAYTVLAEGLEIEKQVFKSSIENGEFRQHLVVLAKK